LAGFLESEPLQAGTYLYGGKMNGPPVKTSNRSVSEPPIYSTIPTDQGIYRLNVGTGILLRKIFTKPISDTALLSKPDEQTAFFGAPEAFQSLAGFVCLTFKHEIS
jgi:hypothetical protein